MSATGYESIINRGDAVGADETDVSVYLQINAPAGYVKDETNLELQYTRVNKQDAADTTVSTAIALLKLATLSTVHTNNSCIFVDQTGDDPAELLLRVDVADGAFAEGADFAIITVRDTTNLAVIASREIAIVHTFAKKNLQERVDIGGGIGTQGGNPGNKQVMIVFTEFDTAAEEYGPEIIGSSIGGNSGAPDTRFLGEILGSYYYDQSSNVVSQVRGKAWELGVRPGVLTGEGVSDGDIITGIST